MSILRSMHTGASGLRSHTSAIGVTGDNIANVNTTGFKRARGVFEDILGRSIAGSNAAPTAGAGSRLAHIEQMWTQGALLTTDSPTDLALSGNGFFMVEGNAGGMQGRFFTRAGQFHIDQQGFLTNPNGMQLLGYPAQADGSLGAQLGALQVAGGTLPANPTTAGDISVNLDANASADGVFDVFDPADPSGTSSHSTSMTVYDSLGNPHDVTLYFANTAANTWEWHAMVDGAEVTGGTPGVPFEGASGTLVFSTDGELQTETPGASSWDFNGATAGQTIAFDFGDAIDDGGDGARGDDAVRLSLDDRRPQSGWLLGRNGERDLDRVRRNRHRRVQQRTAPHARSGGGRRLRERARTRARRRGTLGRDLGQR